MLESSIEGSPRQLVKRLGGFYIKLSPEWLAGIPDRMVLLPKATIFFIELKRPRGKDRPKQPRIRQKLINLGFRVYKIDNKKELEEIILKEYERAHSI